MSRDNQDAYGIEPFAPERDDELAAEAHREEMMQPSEKPIQSDNGEQAQIDAFANSTEDFY
jgi:hypothetical protein